MFLSRSFCRFFRIALESDWADKGFARFSIGLRDCGMLIIRSAWIGDGSSIIIKGLLGSFGEFSIVSKFSFLIGRSEIWYFSERDFSRLIDGEEARRGGCAPAGSVGSIDGALGTGGVGGGPLGGFSALLE